MLQKEALARININKLLEDAGWRFFPSEKGIANIQLEPNVKITQLDLDGLELKKNFAALSVNYTRQWCGCR